MSRRFVISSLELWRRREKYRKRRHTKALRSGDKERQAKWSKLLTEARRNIARREQQLAELNARPRVITQRLSFDNKFGALGDPRYVSAHHSAGPRDRSLEDAKRLNAQYHQQHAGQGWGGIGYHYNITTGGVIIRLRPKWMKGAHVGNYNSNNIGVMFHGNYINDKPNEKQLKAYNYLVNKLHRGTTRRGHSDWPGHTWNACPGTNLRPIVSESRKTAAPDEAERPTTRSSGQMSFDEVHVGPQDTVNITPLTLAQQLRLKVGR